MYKSYHKKVDRSMMDWGLTVPQDFIKDFEAGSPVKLGSSRNIEILWDKKTYIAKLSHVNRRSAKSVFQIRWDSNNELLNKVRKTFIQSYVVLKSQKELFDKAKDFIKHANAVNVIYYLANTQKKLCILVRLQIWEKE